MMDISKCYDTMTVNGTDYKYVNLEKVAEEYPQVKEFPYSIKVLLENALRNYDGFSVNDEHVEGLLNWKPKNNNSTVPYKPARVLMQDFTGVPSVVDIAAVRAEVVRKGKDGSKINPFIPVDLVIDHSVQVDFFGTEYAYQKNVEYEYKRNRERYILLKWAQQAFDNFSVVPPGMGICHQVNLEYLSKTVQARDGWLFPDTLVGTDSHTPMVNGVGVIGWGVGGIEAEAALLGEAIYFSTPEVIGLRISGSLQDGITSTDMVLNITEKLREYGVVGKFVEVFGAGLSNLAVPDRATIANMSPEFGCTVTFFPTDERTIEYLANTNRSQEQLNIVETYSKNNMFWHREDDKINYTDIIDINLDELEPTVAGPKLPQEKILVKDLKKQFGKLLKEAHGRDYVPLDARKDWLSEGGSGSSFSTSDAQRERADTLVENKLQTVEIRHDNREYSLSDGSIVIAAITSCTNTSNPSVMIGAGLVAKKAIEKGLDVKPWVKTSLAPGSKVVTNYLERSGLQESLEALNFHTVGYGCTTCIGNSGPLPDHIDKAVDQGDLVVASVLSGNRNFQARIHNKVKMNFLASPMLVVAYAIAGRVDIDLMNEPLDYDPNGKPVYLKDIWPSISEIQDVIKASTKPEDFAREYDVIFDGDEHWQALDAPTGTSYDWAEDSTYIKEIPFFKDISEKAHAIQDITGAKVLMKLGNSVTTDHISPAGSFSADSPAGKYLIERGVEPKMFNSYGSRRGNHEVMMRGTFANVRVKNELVDREGGYTIYFPENKEMTVYDAAMKYQEDKTPLVVIGGTQYGSGSSRDWAAKGTILLGVRAVITAGYERIHRSNLVQLGVLPLQFVEGEDAYSLGLDGRETYDIKGIADGLTPGKLLDVTATRDDGSKIEFKASVRLDSDVEVEYYKNEGILQYFLRNFLREEGKA